MNGFHLTGPHEETQRRIPRELLKESGWQRGARREIDDKRAQRSLPHGLCGNRDDHEPHVHESATLGTFWCTADQTTRLPFAAEARRKQSHDDLQDHSS